MSSLKVSQFANIAELVSAFRSVAPFSALLRQTSAASRFLEPLLAGPALVADWVLQRKLPLTGTTLLNIAVVSPASGIEGLDNGRWYSLIPDLLGTPRVQVKVSLVNVGDRDGRRSPLSGFNLPYEEARTYQLPLHAYLENLPDGKLDLLVLADADALMDDAQTWADPLSGVIQEGTPVLALASSEDEQFLIAGMLGLYGFTSQLARPSRFAVVSDGPIEQPENLAWGSFGWHLESERVKGFRPGENLEKEAINLFRFVQSYISMHGEYPPLGTWGSVVEGPDSPAPDGRRMIVLPENLYYDPANEQLHSNLDDGLVSLKHLDDYASKSALLASYEGRDTRFMRTLWATRVFVECAENVPDLSDHPDHGHSEHEDGDEERCPDCGHVHSEDGRVEAFKSILQSLVSDETPKVKLKAALQLALAAVDEGGLDLGANGDDEADSEPDDLALYEMLLDRGYLRAAFGMWTEEPELDDEGSDDDGWPLAMLALHEGEFTLLGEMLASGLEFSMEADDGRNLLHVLATMTNGEIPAELIADICARVESVDAPDAEGERPLETAALMGNWPVFGALLEHGAHISGTRIDVATLVETLRREGEVVLASLVEASTPQKTRPATKTPSKRK
jgi:hypothetical protein